MLYFDPVIFCATAAFGWGLSLATYRIFALHYDWPMGDLHLHRPALPVLLGLACLIIGFVFALDRGADRGIGWGMLLSGLLLAVAWTGILRVASQTSLFLAPAAAAVVVFGWIANVSRYATITPPGG